MNPRESLLFWLGGFFALLACAISAHTILRHLYNYRRPDLQRLILRILMMPVVYALCSWLSFGFELASVVLDPVRDFYEAFVLWVFFHLMVAYVGGERELLQRLNDGRLPTYHAFPFHWCLSPVDFSIPANFTWMKRGILQFVLVKAVATVATIVLKCTGHYEEGVISWDSGYIYISVLCNVSIFFSMYYLVLLYVTMRYDLLEHKPMSKFLCIKAVIFFSFWQSFALSLLVKAGVIKDDGQYSANHTAAAIQDFLICMEMVAAAIGHVYCP